MKTYINDKAELEYWLQNYHCSEDGIVTRIKSDPGYGNRKTGKILKYEKTKAGYLRVTLCKNSKTKRYQLHRIVALLYVHNPDPENYNIVNHKDGNPLNCYKENLEWTDASGNLQHAYDMLNRIGPQGEIQGNSKLKEYQVIQVLINKEGHSDTEWAEMFGVAKQTIRDIRTRRRWKHIKI